MTENIKNARQASEIRVRTNTIWNKKISARQEFAQKTRESCDLYESTLNWVKVHRHSICKAKVLFNKLLKKMNKIHEFLKDKNKTRNSMKLWVKYIWVFKVIDFLSDLVRVFFKIT